MRSAWRTGPTAAAAAAAAAAAKSKTQSVASSVTSPETEIGCNKQIDRDAQVAAAAALQLLIFT